MRSPLQSLAVSVVLLLGGASAFAQDDPKQPAAGGGVTPVAGGGLTATELYDEGLKAFNEGRWTDAEQRFTQLLEEYGQNEEAKEAISKLKPMIALSRVRAKKFADALPVIEEVLALKTSSPELTSELFFWRGLCLMQTKQFVDAQIALGEFYKAYYYRKQNRNLTRCHEALILFAVGYTLQGDHAGAVEFMTWQLPKLRRESREAAARVTVLLLYSLMEGEQYDDALKFVREQFEDIEQVTQLISFQSLALELGSTFLEREEYHKAIACLQRIWKRDRLLRHQEERLADLEEKVAILKQRRGMEDFVFRYDGMVRRTRLEVEKFKTIENFDSALRLRLATAFTGLERYREAALIMEDMLENMPPDPVVEGASISLIQSWMQIERWPKAVEAADSYLEHFNNNDQNDRVPLVLLLKGNSLQSDGKLSEAFDVFGEIVERFPTGDFAPRAVFMQGIVKLNLDENKAGVALFKQVQKKFPKHPIAEDALYWEGMAYSFEKDNGLARETHAAYLQRFPKGRYVVDAQFRRAFCRHASADYEGGIEELGAFLKKHPDSRYANEARLLLGDGLLAVGEIGRGIATYKAIDPREVRFFEEGWFKIGKALRLQEKVDEMRAHFEEFVSKYPGSNRMAEAVFWVGWTYRAQEQPEKAKEIYWKTLREHGDVPEYFGMAEILDAMRKVYPGKEGLAELERELQVLASDSLKAEKKTLALRAQWAVGRLMLDRKLATGKVAFYKAAELCDVQVHNPRILADCADFHREAGNDDAAEKLYRGLRKWHPRALEKERAYYGLGMIAKKKGARDEALDWFAKFEKETYGTGLLGDVLLAKAELLGGDEAKLVYEDLLANKSLSSKYKAAALYAYGTMLADEGDDMTAIAYFERLYVAYGKYRDLVAKAYYARGQALERLKKQEEAREVYAELLGRDDLAEYEEVKEARLRMEKL